MEFKVGQEGYTEDGRKAEYAGEIGGPTFVRIIFECEGHECGPEEWASDKLTPVHRVFVSAPLEKYDARVAQALDKLDAIREEEGAVRRSVLDLRQQEKQMVTEIAKFPELQTAMDFLNGRITHVLIENYGELKVLPLHEALANNEDHGYGARTENGLKLLCLFGHEKGKKPRWAINWYTDGSGTYTTVDPFLSEADARAELQARADVAVDAWREDSKNGGAVIKYHKAGALMPEDFLAWLDGVAEQRKLDRIRNLQEEIESLRA